LLDEWLDDFICCLPAGFPSCQHPVHFQRLATHNNVFSVRFHTTSFTCLKQEGSSRMTGFLSNQDEPGKLLTGRQPCIRTYMPCSVRMHSSPLNGDLTSGEIIFPNNSILAQWSVMQLQFTPAHVLLTENYPPPSHLQQTEAENNLTRLDNCKTLGPNSIGE